MRITSLRRMHWVVFFAAVLLGWLALAVMAVPAELRALERVYGADIIRAICGTSVGEAGFLGGWAMWALMSAAMMAPTAVPALRTYDDLSHATETRFGQLVLGYLTVWVGFSALAAAVQLALFEAGLIGAVGQSLSSGFTALLLIGAGLYQFSALKEACLSRCRAPLSFFIQHWEEGPFRNGLRMGLDCVGCCWALMALGFVGGVMNLGFMGLAMLLMTLEKLPDIGRKLTRPMGAGLIAAGLALPLI